MGNNSFVGLNYDKVMEIVTPETATYINNLLGILRGLESDHFVTKVSGGKVENKYHIILLAALESLYQLGNDYATYLNQIGYVRPETSFSTLKTSIDERRSLFSRYGDVLPKFPLFERYRSLVPSHIALNALDIARRTMDSTTNVARALGGYYAVDNFYGNLASLAKANIKTLNHKLYQEFFDGVPVDVVAKMEKACKNLQCMEGYANNYGDSYWINTCTREDKAAVAMLLALTTSDKTDYNEAIVHFLSDNHVERDRIIQSLDLSRVYFTNPPELSITTLIQFFSPYLKDVSDKSKMTVGDLLEKCFDRNLIGSIETLKLVVSFGGDTKNIKNIDAKIKDQIAVIQRQKSQKIIDDFYKDLKYETQEFIELTVKIYELLLKKMQEGKHNKDILLDEDDADTLALFIASYYVNGSVSNFFKGHGITLDNVLKLINITISKEEIDAMKVDGNILTSRFKRFVFDGNNHGQLRERITIQSIILNLCNRDFNRSVIMESIFTKLAHASLDKDFKKQLDEYMADVERKRINVLRNDLFQGLPSETITFLEQLSIVHQMLANVDLEAIQPVAIIYTISLVDNYIELRQFLKTYGLDSHHFEKYLPSHYSYDSRKQVSFDVLNEYYRDYIFGGHNKGKERFEIDVKSILANAFNKELSSTILITKVLGDSALSYDSLQDFDNFFKSYALEKAKEDLCSKRQAVWKYWDINATTYIDNASILFSRIKNKLDSAKEGSLATFTTSDADVEKLAMLLSIYVDDKTKYIRDFFEHNNLALPAILALVGLDASIMKDLAKESADDKVSYEHFAKYLVSERHSYDDLRFVVVRLLKDNSGNSDIIERITKKLGGNYEFLKEEVENLAYHVEVLSPEERLKRLRDQTVSTLDSGDLQSIINFGTGLSEHTKFIYEELPRRAKEDTTGEALKRINDEMGSLYSKPQIEELDVPSKTQGFFGRLFAKPKKEEMTTSKQEPVLDVTLLEQVKEDIRDCMDTLSSELIGYDYIRKYLSTYRAKIIEHRRLFDQAVADLEAKLQKLSPDREEDFDEYVITEGNLRIMRSKAQRFATMQALATQEFVKVTQIIVDHSLSSDALELCRTHLLPFIGMESAISIGLGTEKQALDISETMVGLFHALLTRNISEITSNMARIQAAVPAERYTALEAQLEDYLTSIKAYKEIESKETESFESSTSPFNLTLDAPDTIVPDTPKVKVYTNSTPQPNDK